MRCMFTWPSMHPVHAGGRCCISGSSVCAENVHPRVNLHACMVSGPTGASIIVNACTQWSCLRLNDAAGNRSKPQCCAVAPTRLCSACQHRDVSRGHVDSHAAHTHLCAAWPFTLTMPTEHCACIAHTSPLQVCCKVLTGAGGRRVQHVVPCCQSHRV